MRGQRCHRERDRLCGLAAAVNGPVPPVLSRFAFPWLSPRALRGAHIAFDPATGAARALRGRRRHRRNGAPGRTEDTANVLFPQDTMLAHGPAVLGSVGARGGGGTGSAGLAVPGDTEPWGALPDWGKSRGWRLTTSSGQPPPERSPSGLVPDPRSRVPPAERSREGAAGGDVPGAGGIKYSAPPCPARRFRPAPAARAGV